MSTSIVFVHGMYLNGASWAPWAERATKRGFSTHAPSWPYHEGEPAQLRSAIDPNLGKLDFGAVLDHLKRFIDTLPERPAVVGHSIGGLLAQKLLADGFATAAVAISSAPPQGIFTVDSNFVKANLPHINPFAGNHRSR